MTSLDSVEMIIAWNQLGELVRSGQGSSEHPDSSFVLDEYLSLGDEIAQKGNKRNKFWFYSRMVSQLEDAICDCLVDERWREQCADILFRPLALLASLAETPRERAAAEHRARMAYRQCRYFLCSKSGEQAAGRDA